MFYKPFYTLLDYFQIFIHIATYFIVFFVIMAIFANPVLHQSTKRIPLAEIHRLMEYPIAEILRFSEVLFH